MKENNNNSKQVLLSVLGVAILVVAVVGVSFAAFSYSKTGEQVNTITTGTITMSYSETTNGINLTNAMPVADSVGMAYEGEDEYFDFTVSATISGTTTINYAITAAKISPDSTLPDNAVKVYLTDMDADADTQVLAPTLVSELDAVEAGDQAGASEGEYVLHRGTFTTTTTNMYRLRMWVADTYDVPNTNTASVYKLRVNVYGQAEAQSS